MKIIFKLLLVFILAKELMLYNDSQKFCLERNTVCVERKPNSALCSLKKAKEVST
jgi:hypothetical protein